MWRKFGRLILISLLILLVSAAIYFAVIEVRGSRLQATMLSKLTSELQFTVEPGPNPDLRYPGAGPYDLRLGYRQLPTFIERLVPQGYAVTAQARMSPRMISLSDSGLFVPYREKDDAGLSLRDCRGQPLFSSRFPERVYTRFESVPKLLVNALLYIENRELLDTEYATRNPAIEWDRLGKAALERARHMVNDDRGAPGGSTLATQIEKYRHSPEGRTESVKEKFRQMASASLRAYINGKDTTIRRQQIVLSYLNTVPLAAKAGAGEVNGLGDGLWAWYGRDFNEVNRLLMTFHDDSAASVTLEPPQRRALSFKQALISQQAVAFKQALSLMIAQRRPSYYLSSNETNLGQLTNSHLRAMAEAGVIPTALRDAALPVRLKLLTETSVDSPVSFIERKAATAVRARLAGLLDMPRAYDLDRLDLAADSSLDADAQLSATKLLQSLKDPAVAKEAGLFGFRLLKETDDLSKLVFSFTLYERGPRVNFQRVQTDNYDQPFDINEGSKLDLGSTSKLRTLITYLEIVARLHNRWAGLSPEKLAAAEFSRRDPIARWAWEYLSRTKDKTLRSMLEAAMNRTYSASPSEGFFTGGGLHHFVNFDPKDNRSVMNLHDALKDSVNLVFIRLMRDIVHHFIYRASGNESTPLEDLNHPSRQAYLARFADKEGRGFIASFYKKYQGKSNQEAQALLLKSVRPVPSKLASVFRTIEPTANADRLAEFLTQQLKTALPEKTIRALHEKHAPDVQSLSDRSYIAGVHPLELWLVGYLRHHPKATVSDIFDASRVQRQEIYGWLFKSKNKSAQDSRIRGLIEQDAFIKIQRAWSRLGYPFAVLTPSYASALGASGDRPAALAELMGIIANQGMRLPIAKIGALEFARDTPYETRLEYQPPKAQRVLPAEVARVVRNAVLEVVSDGTARRLSTAFVRQDGSVIEVGGKTGTGDHRFDVHGKGGQLISSRIVNRSATFAFLIGEKYFGTMMVYVHEPHAEKFKFTSALPTQLLKSMAPALMPMLERGSCQVPVIAP